MMRRIASTTAVALAAGALSSGLFWGFLNTPESTVWMLGVSFVLVASIAAVLAVAGGAALLAWAGAGFTRDVWQTATRRVLLCLPAVLLFAIIWRLVLPGEQWVAVHSGEISAWFIARFGWSDVRPLISALLWTGGWLRFVLAPFVALVAWHALLTATWRPLGSTVRRALSPLGLLIATMVMAVLVYVPWMYLLAWRPRALPTGSAEVAFFAGKMAVFALALAVASALLTRTAASRRA